MSSRPRFQQVRDWLFLTVGLAGIIYEAVIHTGPPRWALLTVYITLLGLPGALGLDAVKDRLTSTPPSPPPSPPSPGQPPPTPDPPSLGTQ